MFILGIFIHVMFLFSIFDIYFKSPIVKNVTPYQPQHEPLADRLVLFIVDGLRAESFVNHTTLEYLRTVANSFGRWGISNTQVPTESRPGHVAVIAGFYEDPSAVAKGWKENPVDFDSVFNQTSYTWCWGAYDIVNIFSKGNVDDHIFTNTFDPYDHTFSTNKNTTLLDAWVFDSVKQFFLSSDKKTDLKTKVHEKKIIFFLHLLGTDTSGHTHKPNTQNFINTLRFVDKGIKEMEMVIRDFYNDDGRTTFLMTSDHGMTDWGSHGAGDNHETQTPYVMWGSGVQQVEGETFDPQTSGMSQKHRLDIKQADLAPLMSTILSIPVPVNSIGKLPSELLNITLPNKAKAIHSNSRQLASQYDKKRQDVEKNAISSLYQPYEPFTKQKYTEVIEFSEILLQEDDSERLILLSEEIMDLSLSGLRYYHNYYQKPLLILVTLSFLGWIMYLLRVLSEQKVNSQLDTANKRPKMMCSVLLRQTLNIIFIMLISISIYVVYAQDLPVQYFSYFLMPIALWYHVFYSANVWAQAYRHIRKKKNVFIFWVEVMSYILGSLAMALSFTYRWMLSIPLVGMGLWPFLSSTRNHITKPILFAWPMGCALLSFFSFMPVVGKDVFIELVIISGLAWSVVIIFYIWKVLQPLCAVQKESKREIVLALSQILLMFISLHNIYVQSKRFERGTPVSPIYQAAAWTLAVTSCTLPFAFSKRLICRLTAIYTSILNFYLLLSVSHESLFMVTLIFNVTCWIFIEFRLLHLHQISILEYTFNGDDHNEKTKGFTSVERAISDQDFRRAFFFVLYIILAFFGTGNIASLNSFEVRWVTCFITSFQPFIMTTLILLKTLSPFLIVACSFRAVQHLSKAPTGYLNIIVLIYSNIMGIQLLYNVKNTGSWLEIGTSISQFVIVQVITLFIVIINQIAKLLTDISIHQFADTMFKSRKKYV